MQKRKQHTIEARALPVMLVMLVSFGLVGCQEDGPMDLPSGESGLTLAKPGGGKGKPARCMTADLRITFRDAAGDALRSDGRMVAPEYEEGVENVGAHINAETGRLMLWPSQYGEPARFVNVTTAETSYPTTDRIYTNNHDGDGDGNEDACGLFDIPLGGTGVAVLQAEGDENGIVNYGKDCDGNVVDVPGVNEKVDVTRDDANLWTITGAYGVHCLTSGGGKKKTVTQTQASGFSMTLEGF